MMRNSHSKLYGLSNAGVFQMIGDYVKSARLERNITQEELAAKAGVNRSTLYYFERGERGNMDTFIRLMRAIDAIDFFEKFEPQQNISPLALADMEKRKPIRASKKK